MTQAVASRMVEEAICLVHCVPYDIEHNMTYQYESQFCPICELGHQTSRGYIFLRYGNMQRTEKIRNRNNIKHIGKHFLLK